jgi:hypothetical protein
MCRAIWRYQFYYIIEMDALDKKNITKRVPMNRVFVRLVADGWCWFVLREKYCWLIAGGWFVLREKHCWLVADKPNEQGKPQSIY